MSHPTRSGDVLCTIGHRILLASTIMKERVKMTEGFVSEPSWTLRVALDYCSPHPPVPSVKTATLTAESMSSPEAQCKSCYW